MVRYETTKLQGSAEKCEGIVAVFGVLQGEVLAAKKAVAELSPIAEKTGDTRVDVGKNVHSCEMELSLLRHREALFDGLWLLLTRNCLRLELIVQLYGGTGTKCF